MKDLAALLGRHLGATVPTGTTPLGDRRLLNIAAMAAPATRERLSPDVFRLPGRADPRRLLHRRVLQLHEGAARGHRPPAARADAGLPEARGVDRRRDRRGDRRSSSSAPGERDADGSVARRLGRAGGARAVRGRRGRRAGDRHDDRGRLRAVRAPGDRLPGHARAAQPGDEERARRGRRRARQADPVHARAPRPLARADRRRLGGARGRGDRRVDRRAGVVVGRPRHRHGAARADRRVRRRHRRGRAPRSPTATPTR